MPKYYFRANGMKNKLKYRTTIFQNYYSRNKKMTKLFD